MRKNSNNNQKEGKDGYINENSCQTTTITKPKDDFKKDLQGKSHSFQQHRSTQETLKTEIEETNNLQLEPDEKMECEPFRCSGEEKPFTKMVEDKCLKERKMKNRNSLNVDASSLGSDDSSKLNLKQEDSPKLKDPHTSKDDLSREQLTKKCCTVPSSTLPESEASQQSVFTHPELEQEGKQLSFSAQKDSSVISSLPTLPPRDVSESDERGRKSIPKKVYVSIVKPKWRHVQGGRDARLKPLHQQSQTQVPHTMPHPALAVSPETKTQLVTQSLQPKLDRFLWPLKSRYGVLTTNSTCPLPKLYERLWFGFHSFCPRFSIPPRFPFPASHYLALPEGFHVKETHGGRKGADKPPDQDTGGTSTGSGGAGGGEEESGGGQPGGEAGMSSSGASGGGSGDPPKKPEPTTSSDEEEEVEEEEEEEEEEEDKKQPFSKTQEDSTSGYKSSEKVDSLKWSSSQSSEQTSTGTTDTTEQGALLAQESSGAGFGVHSITGHYTEFYTTDMQASHTLMSLTQRNFCQTLSPSISPLHTPSQSPPTSPNHAPSSTSPPPSPSSSVYPPTLPMSMQETQPPMAQSAQLVVTVTGQDQPLSHEPQHNADVGEEPAVEPDLIPFQNGPMPSQNDPIPFLSPHGEGQGLFPLGLESRSVHDSDSSSEKSRDSG